MAAAIPMFMKQLEMPEGDAAAQPPGLSVGRMCTDIGSGVYVYGYKIHTDTGSHS